MSGTQNNYFKVATLPAEFFPHTIIDEKWFQWCMQFFGTILRYLSGAVTRLHEDDIRSQLPDIRRVFWRTTALIILLRRRVGLVCEEDLIESVRMTHGS